MELVNLQNKFGLVKDYWTPAVVTDFNGLSVKIVKVKGEFVWHHHDDTDELFWVYRGELLIHLKDRVVLLRQDEMFVVPKNVEHKTAALDETWIIMIEPRDTVNTGNVVSDKTVVRPQAI